MSGHYRMARGWMDHPVFKRERFTEREAWQWLIEQAAFKPREYRIGRQVIPLKRGELVTSVRYLQKAWGWKSTSRIVRFLDRLKNGTGGDAMIETAIGSEHTIITICHYDHYQATLGKTEQQTEQPPEHQTGQPQNGDGTKQKEGKELPSYKYTGRVIALNATDYDRWRKAYHAIPDFDAELARIDDALSAKLKPGEQWFAAASAMLAAKHQAILKANPPKIAAATVPAKSEREIWADRLAKYTLGGRWLWGARPETGYCDAPEDLVNEWKQRQAERVA